MRLLFLLHLKCTVIKFAAGEFPQGEPFCPVRFNKKGPRGIEDSVGCNSETL